MYGGTMCGAAGFSGLSTSCRRKANSASIPGGNGSWKESGDLGSWCCLSADEELGYVYVPLGAPTAAYYGGHRPGDNLFSNSLVVLDVSTAERVWHFQMVHHDLWEYDTVGPPTLGEITVDGR